MTTDTKNKQLLRHSAGNSEEFYVSHDRILAKKFRKENLVRIYLGRCRCPDGYTDCFFSEYKWAILPSHTQMWLIFVSHTRNSHICPCISKKKSEKVVLLMCANKKRHVLFDLLPRRCFFLSISDQVPNAAIASTLQFVIQVNKCRSVSARYPYTFLTAPHAGKPQEEGSEYFPGTVPGILCPQWKTFSQTITSQKSIATKEQRINAWQLEIERKGLRVNAKKTEVMNAYTKSHLTNVYLIDVQETAQKLAVPAL
ncbi:hypothetical protein GQR58_020978 [Nymphon striatum]|nr:hypothetical protein GQR58_020978 [Nymphon striatum]